MLTTLVSLLVLQGGNEVVRPPKMTGMLSLSVRPVGTWKVAKRDNPGAVQLRAGKSSNLVFSGNESTMKFTPMLGEMIVKANGLIWHVSIDEIKPKNQTRFDATAVTPGKQYNALGRFEGMKNSQIAKDALATLKTFKPL